MGSRETVTFCPCLRDLRAGYWPLTFTPGCSTSWEFGDPMGFQSDQGQLSPLQELARFILLFGCGSLLGPEERGEWRRGAHPDQTPK